MTAKKDVIAWRNFSFPIYASYILLSLFNNHNNERSALGSLHLKPARYQQRLQTINYNSN
jgi:hypothetical protein